MSRKRGRPKDAGNLQYRDIDNLLLIKIQESILDYGLPDGPATGANPKHRTLPPQSTATTTTTTVNPATVASGDRDTRPSRSLDEALPRGSASDRRVEPHLGPLQTPPLKIRRRNIR
jgi:hypothetical protein